ncbi:kinetochore protein NDC80 homolog [Varroa destructor]|uniref:Kinetochore protein NDC80 n=1 Tax=Varroa destructor TaxID=109461 RepID=A0A7M7K8C3_VARDE|nr:kinetochore protein NDC80 homolog [Varroa destructor]
MNRKSQGLSLRKSIRPRESQVPSAVVPSSARRGFANRSILDTTRNSVGSGRISLYGQVNQKDPRVFNDDFIKRTFGRIRDFLIQQRLSAEIVPTTSKLTLKQFENIFKILFGFIEPAYIPPSGNQWIEQEVPILMDGLGYPHKVTKSMMQTVSSKPGPVVGILDYTLDVVTAVECDPVEAIRLMQKEDAVLQVETEELARISFMEGLSVNDSKLKAQVLDLTTRHKGILDEEDIRVERERIHNAKQEAETQLQYLEEQLAEQKGLDKQIEDLEEYLEQMESRHAHKETELEAMKAEKAKLAQQISDTEELIKQTKLVVDTQPISAEEIRSMRSQTTELEATRSSLASKMRAVESEYEAVSGSIRIAESELEMECGKIAQLRPGGSRVGPQSWSRDEMITCVKKADQSARLMNMINEEANLINAKIAECRRIAEDNQTFELNRRKKQQEVDYQKQDKEALDEKMKYFSARLDEKLKELLSQRQAVSNHETQIVLLDKEVEDLKAERKRQSSLLSVAEAKLHQQNKEDAAALKVLEIEKQKVERTIAADRVRMEQLATYYRESFAALNVDSVIKAVLQKLEVDPLRSFVSRFMDIERSEQLGSSCDPQVKSSLQ